VENKTIVIGFGGTHVVSAALYAVSRAYGKPINVFSQTPYYSGYPSAFTINNILGVWNASYNQDPTTVAELVTTPNNPDCAIRGPYYQNPKFRIYDMVYYWPSFTNITRAYDEDIMLFSASKMTGHAGNRFGWAVVRDPTIALYMNTYIALTTSGVSSDIQYKMSLIFSQLLATGGDEFQWVRTHMAERYSTLRQVLNSQPSPQRFSLESEVGGYYLWLHCLWPADQNCAGLFNRAGITVYPGESFGGDSSYVRVNFAMYDNLLDIFIERLQDLSLNKTDALPQNVEVQKRSQQDELFHFGC